MGGGPQPAVGAALIAAAAVVLISGLVWLTRGGSEDRLAMPTVDGVTMPTDDDGQPVEEPPSQPATPVVFGPNGEILRPDPVRARIVDSSGEEVLVTLPPNTTVDTITGAIIPTQPGTTTTRPTSTTDHPHTTPTTQPSTTTSPPTTEPPTTEPPTTEPPTTDPPPTTIVDPGILDGIF